MSLIGTSNPQDTVTNSVANFRFLFHGQNWERILAVQNVSLDLEKGIFFSGAKNRNFLELV